MQCDLQPGSGLKAGCCLEGGFPTSLYSLILAQKKAQLLDSARARSRPPSCKDSEAYHWIIGEKRIGRGGQNQEAEEGEGVRERGLPQYWLLPACSFAPGPQRTGGRLQITAWSRWLSQRPRFSCAVDMGQGQ